MNKILSNPLAFFDIEATGLNVSKDRIVEIAIVKIYPDGSRKEFHSLVNPEIEIPQDVIDIHGITNEKITKAPVFKDIADDILSFISDADLAGYNINKLDIPILAEELLRAGKTFDLSNKKLVDVQNIFHKMEQRTLAAAYQFYCNKNIENQHSALGDTNATIDVFEAQLEKYTELSGKNIEFLADFSKNTNHKMVDFAGRLLRNENDEVIYNFGKHKGKTVEEVSVIEPGYYGWFVGNSTDFPQYTKLKLKEEFERLKIKKSEQKNITIDDLQALKDKFKK